jgi:hypothetical protein
MERVDGKDIFNMFGAALWYASILRQRRIILLCRFVASRNGNYFTHNSGKQNEQCRAFHHNLLFQKSDGFDDCVQIGRTMFCGYFGGRGSAQHDWIPQTF